MKIESIARNLRVALAVSMLGLTGCQNGNLFGKLHDSGDSGSSDALISDASIALQHKDFASALSLYQRVLDQDSGNSTALYGAAVAQMALSGLNFGELLANVLNNDGSVGASSLAEVIQSNSSGYSSSVVIPTSILSRLSLVGPLIAQATNNLKKIVQGSTDGVIPSNDVATLVDLGIGSLIHVAFFLFEQNVCDIVNDNGDLKVISKVSAAAYCSDSAHAGEIAAVGFELCNAYEAINRAAAKVGTSNQLLSRFRGDVDTLIQDGLDADGHNDLDPACVTALSNAGITAANFRTKSDL